MRNSAKKEHIEHQKALKPLLKHLKADEEKLKQKGNTMAKHKLTHAEEVKGGEHSHAHHKKLHDHHMSEAKKHADHLHKMAKHAHKSHHKAK